MAVNQDELYALFDQATARGGSRSPALARMQSFDPAINPPPAPRNVTPAALTPAPRQPLQGDYIPALPKKNAAPATPQPQSWPSQAGTYVHNQFLGAGRAVKDATRPLVEPLIRNAPAMAASVGGAVEDFGLAAVGAAPRARVPTKRVAKATVHPLNPLNGNTATAIPSGSAAGLPSSARVLSATQAPAAPQPAGPLSKITRKGNAFSAPDDAGTVTLADARNAGKSGYGLSVIGMGLSPEATVAKLKGQTEQARQLNRMKATGLSEAELAKVDARRAKDSEIHQLSQSGISPEQAAGAIFNRERALAERTVETPSQSALNQQALFAGEQGLQKGAQELEKGAAELQQEQEYVGLLDKLASLNDETDPGGKQRTQIKEQALLIKNKYVQPVAQKSLGYGVYTDPATGATVSYNKDTGVTGQQGGAQAVGGQGLPEGVTAESARTNALEVAKQDPSQLAAINQKLAARGLPPITEADLG